ncbi:hypothetical protein KOW79_002016, partial [Hemibagrus wyckioides]
VLPLVLSFSRKYYLIQQGKTWSNAQGYCRATYTDLAIIKTNEEMTKLQSVAQAQLFYSYAWIGMYTNINKWYWTFKNESLGIFTSWQGGEPNNLYGAEVCVFTYYGKWYDAPCDWLLHFLCYDDQENATERYILIAQYKTWDDAKSYCMQYHTDLASARNSTENSIVQFYWGWTWIGLRRDPWFWTDQTTNMSVIKWWSGSADDYLQNKSCVYLYSALADIEKCSTLLPFFCYLYPTQQKIIRMKVKSSQDVMDPAIMSAIEEKLKQKLMNYGMAENITVTWRKQPDGVVFHKEKENITAVVNNSIPYT